MTTSNAAKVAFLISLLLSVVSFRPSVEPVTAAPAAPTTADLTTVSAVARIPTTGYVRFVRASNDDALFFVGLQNGTLLRSADGGTTWTTVHAGIPGGPGLQILDLEISLADPKVIWATGLDGVYRSVDGGVTWREADTRSDSPARAIGSVLALDPRHPLAAYLAGYRNGGFYRTSDGGRSWQETLPYPVAGIAVDPASGANIYAVSRTAGLQSSNDHGQSWSKGIQLGRYAGIGDETANPGRLLMVSGTTGGLYVALDGGGILRSLTNGRTWQDISVGLPQSPSGSGLTVPSSLMEVHDTLYTLLPGGGSGGSLYGLVVSPLEAPSSPLSTTTVFATPQPSGTSILTGTATPQASSAGATATTWQLQAQHIDAVGLADGKEKFPLIAADGGASAGIAATLSLLGGNPLYRIPYQLPAPSIRVLGSGFASGATPWPYLNGINYEGPDDRPWQMWQDGKFDPVLIERDLDAAATTGYKVIRVFVQDPLPQEVVSGEFGHLDTLVAAARQRDLRLLITFNDSRNPDLRQVAEVDHLIAAHLTGNPTILGYDLQNEPSFPDIVGAIYPTGVAVPFQSTSLIRAYGERISLKTIIAAQKAGSYNIAPFAHMSVQQIYVYQNINQLLGDALAADPNYPMVSPSAKWAPFFAAANATLSAFIAVQVQAVRSVDRAHLITVGYNRLFWAMLPANQTLDFRSIHLYPNSQDWPSIHDALRSFEGLRALAATPLVLGEYGFSTASQTGDVTSIQETTISLYLRVLGGEGDIKWVLNDDLVGYNSYENGLGLFGRGGLPKPGFYVNREMSRYFSGPHQPGGVSVSPDSSTGTGYLYSAPDALGVSGGAYSDSRLRFQPSTAGTTAQFWVDWATPGMLRFVSTHDGELWFDLASLTGAVLGPLSLSPSGSFDRVGLKIHLLVHAGTWYSLTFTPGANLPPLKPDLPRPMLSQGWYILATGHNVIAPLLSTWLALGGTAIAGLPLDDPQPRTSGQIQYFSNVALETASARVTLVPLGLRAVGGHPLPAVVELPKKKPHLYFSETGHNLRGAFLHFWQSTGGAAVWGPPVSEEQTKGLLTVQYMANAEFVWDGSTVFLAPLGSRYWSS